MLISLKEIVQKYNLNIKGVIQVGAHWAEEHDTYVQLGVGKMIYIEPCRAAIEVLNKKFFTDVKVDAGSYPCYIDENGGLKFTKPDYHWTKIHEGNVIVCECACSETKGVTEMYVSNDNQGQSNSVLKPQLHLKQHPEVRFNETEKVDTIPLDELMNHLEISGKLKQTDYNLLMMDVQGAEGLVLKGATETLKHIDCIYTEVNRAQTYEGNMEIYEMDEYLKGFGFARVETEWASENLSWGDSCYIRETLLPL